MGYVYEKKDEGMWTTKTIAIIVIVIVVVLAGVGAFLILQPTGSNGQTQPPPNDTPLSTDSYVMVSGEFDAIDVYTYYTSDSGISYSLQAHIEHSDQEYPIGAVASMWGDHGLFGRFHVFIFNGNVTDHMFLLAEKELYNFELDGIEFEFYWFD